MSNYRIRSAYTMIEVLAGLLVLSLGLIAACAMILYGVRLTSRAHARSIAMTTAMTVLADPRPLVTYDDADPIEGAVSSGYLNGMWVERRELDAQNLDSSLKLKAVTVRVDVFETTGGDCILSAQRRLIREKP